jgi:response regulator of citrate/malate metabolism
LIEDEKNFSNTIKKRLQEEGYSVDVAYAYDGEEGLYMAENLPADVIVLDIMLPKLDGLLVWGFTFLTVAFCNIGVSLVYLVFADNARRIYPLFLSTNKFTKKRREYITH